MQKWITLLMTLWVGCGSYAHANTGQITLEAGYRHDTINWKHEFPSNDPVVSSNLRFKDLDIFQIAVHGRSTLGCNLYVRGSAYWGWILDGDYEGSANAYLDQGPYVYEDNFRFGFSDHRYSIVDDKYVFGLGAAVGYPFYFCEGTLFAAPVIGYAFDKQNIRVDDKGFDLCGISNPLFPQNYGSGCCRQTFISRWYGPFVGADFDYRPWNSCFNLWAEIEYHWGFFRGKRSNFEADGFDSFDDRNRSSRNAKAWVFGAGVDYDLSNAWTVGLSLKFQDWTANRHHRYRRGLDEYVDASFGDDRIKTNHKWHSYAINLTFGRDF